MLISGHKHVAGDFHNTPFFIHLAFRPPGPSLDWVPCCNYRSIVTLDLCKTVNMKTVNNLAKIWKLYGQQLTTYLQTPYIVNKGDINMNRKK